MVTELVLLTAALAGPASARENRQGLQAWAAKDTSGAIAHLAKAARDTSDPRYAFNLGTVRSLAHRPGADSAFGRALRSARGADDSSRILYNRGTARLRDASQGKGDPAQCVQDLREALRRKPGWKEAARNLELALRLSRPQGGGGKDKPDPKPDPKKDPKSPPQGGQDDKPQERPSPPTGMTKDDADRMLDGAQAKEHQQERKPVRKEAADGPDW